MSGVVLTFTRAAAELGMGSDIYAGRRLRRLVLAKERKAGVEIAVRGAGQTRPIRGVLLAAIRHHMPELSPPPTSPRADRAALIAEARSYLREFDQRMTEVARSEAEASIRELVQPQLDELRSDSNEALRMCRDIAQRLPAMLPKSATSNDTAEGRKTVQRAG